MAVHFSSFVTSLVNVFNMCMLVWNVNYRDASAGTKGQACNFAYTSTVCFS